MHSTANHNSLTITKHILIFISIMCLISCNKVQWRTTSDGKYIYGKLPKGKEIVWTGHHIGPLVSGKGHISILNDKGEEHSREEVTATLGAIEGYNYTPMPDGRYLGERKDNIPHGFGVLVINDTLFIGNFKKGLLHSDNVFIWQIQGETAIPVFKGGFKKGEATGIGIEYHDGELKYEGGFKNGKYHGLGKEYSESMLIYEGEWSNNLRNGHGVEYNKRGVEIYSGGWKKGVYNGKGRLYENGKCIEGKWNDGRLSKSISTSFIEELGNATKVWFSNKDSLNLQTSASQDNEMILPTSQMEFIEQLNVEIEEHLTAQFKERVEDRFGFWHLPRMLVQPWFKSDIKRANYAQKYLCQKVKATDIEKLINAKIDYYNQSNSQNNLNYISLDKIKDGDIVNTDIALKIFEREAMETTDIVVGILVDILVCFVIAFIIGFIIGLFFPILLPYVGIVDIIMIIASICIGFYLSIFRTTTISIELEATISRMLVDSYMQFLDTQNVIFQMIGTI